jgi:hypothetical protein
MLRTAFFAERQVPLSIIVMAALAAFAKKLRRAE